MAKILFDIAAPHEPDEWSNGQLVLEVSPHIVSYAVINSNKKLLQLRFYELDTASAASASDELARLLTADAFLNKPVADKTIVYNFPECELVPAEYYTADKAADLVTLLHGDLHTGAILSEQVGDNNQYNVYRVPGGIHELLQSHFTGSHHWHYYSLWIKADQQQAYEEKTFLSVLFYPNRILVSVMREGQLQLLQSYSYDAAEDVAYHLLNICQQLELPAASTPLMLSGMIDAGSAMFTEINKYFGQVSLKSFPGCEAILPSLGEYPAHFFSPLLKLAICVS